MGLAANLLFAIGVPQFIIIGVPQFRINGRRPCRPRLLSELVYFSTSVFLSLE
jgi:hypothetical protein